jgi:hypothetical protein
MPPELTRQTSPAAKLEKGKYKLATRDRPGTLRQAMRPGLTLFPFQISINLADI